MNKKFQIASTLIDDTNVFFSLLKYIPWGLTMNEK